MPKVKLNKTFDFEIHNVAFGDLTKEEAIDICKDGRLASHFLELQLTKWFPELTHVTGCKDHDHVDQNGTKYDAKNFTRSSGLYFGPSNMRGSKRKFIQSVAHEKASCLIYICCDIVDFPQVRVLFRKGTELIVEYPKCNISLGKRAVFFEQLDQFYTQRSVTQRLIKLLEFDDYDIVLEPSAGDGAFFDYLPKGKRVGIDLEPANPLITKGNFFEWQAIENKRYFVVGNPPFGKNSSLAKKFFNHAAQFADKIAFVVPRTFRKTSVTNSLDKHFWLTHEELLPKDSFYLPSGESYDVPCVFQVWEKRETQRQKIALPIVHSDFNFVERTGADFAIRRVGGLAGKPFKDFSKLATPSHYFIKQLKSDVLEKLTTLWLTVFSVEADPTRAGVKWDTAGNPSLSKTELISHYESMNNCKDG